VISLIKEHNDLFTLGKKQQVIIDIIKRITKINIKLYNNTHQKVIIFDEKKCWKEITVFTPTRLNDKNDSVVFNQNSELSG